MDKEAVDFLRQDQAIRKEFVNESFKLLIENTISPQIPYDQENNGYFNIDGVIIQGSSDLLKSPTQLLKTITEAGNNFPEGASPLYTRVRPRSISKSQGGLKRFMH